MTNEELKSNIETLVQRERRISRQLVEHLRLALDRRFYDGRPSLFDWLTTGLGYSRSAAQRRIDAARALRIDPESAAKIETGEVTVSSLAQMQTAIRQQERTNRKSLPMDEKKKLIQALDGKTQNQVEQLIAETFPNQAPSERIRQINADQFAVTTSYDHEMMELLAAAKAAYSNFDGNASGLDVQKAALKFFIHGLGRKQSLRRRVLLERAGHQCQWRDDQSTARCSATHFLQEDHIIPRALGGTNQLSNLRILCFTHNQEHAARCFGREKMSQYQGQAHPERSSG